MRAWGVVADVVVIAAALLVKVVPLSPALVERRYADGIYPPIDRAVRALTGPLPFTLGDLLLAIALAWLGRYWYVAVRRARGSRVRAAGRALLRTVAVLAAIFVWFELSWAFNYARIPLADKIVVHDARTDEDTVGAFADRVNDLLTRYADLAHAHRLDDATMQTRLIPTFEATIARLGDDASFAPPRIKPTIFQPMMQLSATSGFTDPWTHEVNVDASSFFYERPAIYAHEWAHIAGFADESEANFISVIACTTSHDPLLIYSGWVLVWFNLPPDVKLTHKMGHTAYEDIVAVRARYLKNVNPSVEHVQREAYDSYLKSNHVKAGFASYRLFIRWMTGADFDRAGLPIVKEHPTP